VKIFNNLVLATIALILFCSTMLMANAARISGYRAKQAQAELHNQRLRSVSLDQLANSLENQLMYGTLELRRAKELLQQASDALEASDHKVLDSREHIAKLESENKALSGEVKSLRNQLVETQLKLSSAEYQIRQKDIKPSISETLVAATAKAIVKDSASRNTSSKRVVDAIKHAAEKVYADPSEATPASAGYSK